MEIQAESLLKLIIWKNWQMVLASTQKQLKNEGENQGDQRLGEMGNSKCLLKVFLILKIIRTAHV